MRTIFRTPVGMACLALSGLSAVAGPLQRGDVPGDPAWLLHVDVDGIKATSLGKFILGEIDKPENQNKLAALQAFFNFDFRNKLHGATIYSVGSAPEDAVAVVYADFDSERLSSLAKSAQDAKSTTYKKHVIHNWVDEKKSERNGVKPRTYATLAGKRVIFSQREETVKQALDVVDGAAPSLAKSGNFAQLGKTGDGNFLEGAARKLPVRDSDPNAALLKMAKGVRFQIGESEGQISANLALETSDTDTARNMASVAQGLVGLLRLQGDSNPEALKLADAIAPKQDGNSVVVKLTLPSDEIFGMIKKGAIHKAQKRDR